MRASEPAIVRETFLPSGMTQGREVAKWTGLRVTGGTRVRWGLNDTARNTGDIGIESYRRNKGEIGTECYNQG